MKSRRIMVCMFCVLAMVVGIMAGCGRPNQMTDAEYEELAKENAASNAKKVVLTVTRDGKTREITLDMIMYYLVYNETEGNQAFLKNEAYFKEIYGNDVNFWEIPVARNATYKDTYMSTVYDSVVYTMLMYYEAVDAGMELTESRQKALDSTTEQFLAKYTPAERARTGLTKDVVRANYERIFMADQYSALLATNVKVTPEDVKKDIDRELYRKYEAITLYLTKSNDNPELAAKAGDSAQRLKTMQDCYEAALKGEDFAEIQKRYSEIMYLRSREYRRVEGSSAEPDFIEALLGMEPGEVKLVDSSYGIYVIKLLNKSNYEGYEDAVNEAVSAAQNKGINEIFSKIEEKYQVTRTDAWGEIEMGTILKAK